MHWTERARELIGGDIERAKVAMRNTIAPPVARRPNVGPMVQQAIADPTSVDASGRDYIFERLKDKYGDLADFVAPYLGIEDEGDFLAEEGMGIEEEIY